MKNLVTGASGFVGSHIAEKLVKKGEEVIALVRETSDTSFLHSINADIYKGTITGERSMDTLIRKVDNVYHSAAVTGEWVKRKEAEEINVHGTGVLLRSCLKHGIKQFIHVSSLGVMGLHHHYGTSAKKDDYTFVNDNYIDTKIKAEQLVKAYQKKGVPTTIMRPGFVYGPGDRRLIRRILEKMRAGKFLFIGDGSNGMNIVYVGNFADAVYLAGHSGKAVGQEYNVTDNSNITFNDFIFKIADLWGIELPTQRVPVKVAKVVAHALEGISRFLGKKEPPLLTKTRLKFMTLNLEFDISKTIADLNYEPEVDIDEGLRRTKEWIDKNNPYHWDDG